MNSKPIKVIAFTVGSVFVLTGCSLSPSAKQYYKNGIAYLEDGKYEEAETSLKKAVVEKSERAEYLIAYGMSLIQTKKFDEALRQFDLAISTKDNTIARENNKNAYRGIGIAYYESRDYKKAVAAFNTALDYNVLEDLNVDILYYRGSAQEKLGLYEEALQSYNVILRDEKTEDPNVYAKKALMEYYLKKYKDASADYDKAIIMDTNNYELYFGKYFMLKELGKEEQANEVLDNALNIRARSKSDRFNVAKIHYFKGDFEQAKTELDKIAKKGYSMANYYLGEISALQKDYNNAINYYLQYIAMEKELKSATVYNVLGLCYLKTKEYNKALETFQEGIKFNDNEVMKALEFNEIVAYENLIQFDKAFEKAKIYLDKYPEDKEMKREFAFIMSRAGKKE